MCEHHQWLRELLWRVGWLHITRPSCWSLLVLSDLCPFCPLSLSFLCLGKFCGCEEGEVVDYTTFMFTQGLLKFLWLVNKKWYRHEHYTNQLLSISYKENTVEVCGSWKLLECSVTHCQESISITFTSIIFSLWDMSFNVSQVNLSVVWKWLQLCRLSVVVADCSITGATMGVAALFMGFVTEMVVTTIMSSAYVCWKVPST